MMLFSSIGSLSAQVKGYDGTSNVTYTNKLVYTDSIRAEVLYVNSSTSIVINTNSGRKFGNFAIGDKVLLMQMVGSNAGFHESGIVSGITTLGGGQEAITLGINSNERIINYTNFATGSGNKVQLIKIPEFLSLTIDYSHVTCHAWDEYTGGVICITVYNNLEFQHYGIINAGSKGYTSTGVTFGQGGAGGIGDDTFNNNYGGTMGCYQSPCVNCTDCIVHDGTPGEYGDAPSYLVSDGSAGTATSGSILSANGTTNYTNLKILMGEPGWYNLGSGGGTGAQGGGHGGTGGLVAGIGTPLNGQAGHNGEPGGNAGNDGRGGGIVLIKAGGFVNNSTSNSGIVIYADGENGKNGGNGGLGGKGGQGGNGVDGYCYKNPLIYTQEHIYASGGYGGFGKPGKGGKGGDGGNGGKSGRVWLLKRTTGATNKPSNTWISIKGGKGGRGGQGGYAKYNSCTGTKYAEFDLTPCADSVEWCSDSTNGLDTLKECNCDKAMCILGTADFISNGSGIYSYYIGNYMPINKVARLDSLLGLIEAYEKDSSNHIIKINYCYMQTVKDCSEIMNNIVGSFGSSSNSYPYTGLYTFLPASSINCNPASNPSISWTDYNGLNIEHLKYTSTNQYLESVLSPMKQRCYNGSCNPSPNLGDSYRGEDADTGTTASDGNSNGNPSVTDDYYFEDGVPGPIQTNLKTIAETNIYSAISEPGKNQLIIRIFNPANEFDIQLIDASGKLIASKLFNKENSIDNEIILNNINPGVYYLRLYNTSSSFVKKVLVL